MAAISHQPKHTTLSSLPFEIQHEILLHLLIEPIPIWIRDPHGIPWTSDKHRQQHLLQWIDITPNSRDLFYRHNTFYVSHDDLRAFLDFRPSITVPMVAGTTPTPRESVRHLIVSIQPHLLSPGDDVGAAVRNLLDCPNLNKVEIKIMGFLEGVCEFDTVFKSIAGVCSELGDRLGDDGLKVDCRYLCGEFTWSLAQFKSGVPPR
ncbi:MAG: hypothetical protein LQ346_006751 [Caloplaca aetnensis]|nr:MAG: hypothetical protein LQ346_006751 [Caloplaca aetnensis]